MLYSIPEMRQLKYHPHIVLQAKESTSASRATRVRAW